MLYAKIVLNKEKFASDLQTMFCEKYEGKEYSNEANEQLSKDAKQILCSNIEINVEDECHPLPSTF